MIIHRNFVFFLMMINTLPFAMSVSIRQLVKHDVFVNNNKGYALRRLGIYSANIVEQIIHSIIPLNDLCVTQPNANICSYSSQLRTTKIFELSTCIPGSIELEVRRCCVSWPTPGFFLFFLLFFRIIIYVV